MSELYPDRFADALADNPDQPKPGEREWDRLLFTPERSFQAAEANEIASIIDHYLSLLGRS